jgi:hypothetical protein
VTASRSNELLAHKVRTKISLSKRSYFRTVHHILRTSVGPHRIYYNRRTTGPFCDSFRDGGRQIKLHAVFRDVDMMDSEELLRFVC